MTDETGGTDLSPAYLKQAMKAFKKRLKLTQLDEDSSLGGGPFSGRKSQIVAIQAPNQYPRQVWEKLVEMGKLRRAGGGLYELVREQPPH